MAEPPTSDQPELFIATVIAEELKVERSVGESLQTRGLAVISSSGTLVTLLFGLAAVATKAEHYNLPGIAKPFLYSAATFFVAAAITGIVTNSPRRTKRIDLADLEVGLDRTYWQDGAEAQREVALAQCDVARSSRRKNRAKARYLSGAIILEICGIASAAGAVIMLVASG